MRAGPLDRRITIQQRTVTKNSAGGAAESWSTWNTVWAQKTDVRGAEPIAATKENAKTFTKWRIRHISGLKAEMRIIYDGQVYNIIRINELGRRDGLEIETESAIS